MKNLIYILFAFVTIQSKAQKLEKVFVHPDISTHFVSHEEIKYVDISTQGVVGDIPLPNILRIKPASDTVNLGVITIIGERYLKQYELIWGTKTIADKEIVINPVQATSYLLKGITITKSEMRDLSRGILKNKPSYHAVKSKGNGIEISLNNIYTLDDFFFIDFTVKNKTNIKYDIDKIGFTVVDKKQTKSTNFQEIEIPVEFILNDISSFQKDYRNVFVFRKFTFPDDKVFNIEFAESQISGRVINLQIDYSDILKADVLK
jgi:conjugative transposon TraN protein